VIVFSNVYLPELEPVSSKGVEFWLLFFDQLLEVFHHLVLDLAYLAQGDSGINGRMGLSKALVQLSLKIVGLGELNGGTHEGRQGYLGAVLACLEGRVVGGNMGHRVEEEARKHSLRSR